MSFKPFVEVYNMVSLEIGTYIAPWNHHHYLITNIHYLHKFPPTFLIVILCNEHLTQDVLSWQILTTQYSIVNYRHYAVQILRDKKSFGNKILPGRYAIRDERYKNSLVIIPHMTVFFLVPNTHTFLHLPRHPSRHLSPSGSTVGTGIHYCFCVRVSRVRTVLFSRSLLHSH